MFYQYSYVTDFRQLCLKWEVHALDRAATVIGTNKVYIEQFKYWYASDLRMRTINLQDGINITSGRSTQNCTCA
jgi:hypothetical protein